MSRMIGRTDPRAGTLISMPSAPSASTSARLGVLDVEPIDDRLQRRHPAKHLERHLHRLVRLGDDHRLLHRVAGRLDRAGERAAEHDRVAAEEQRLHDRAVALDAAVGDERHARAGGGAAGDQRFDLRHAEVRVEPGRAAAAGTDADLDAVDAALDEEARPFGGGDIAGDQLDVAELLAERLDRAAHHRRVPVGDVDDDHVRAGAQQLGGALEVVAFGADRGADPQAAVVVARGEGQPLLLQEIRGGHQTDQPAVAIDERQLLDLVGAHDLFARSRRR